MSEFDMKKMVDWLNVAFVSNHNSNDFCLPPRESIPSVSVSPSMQQTVAKTYYFAGKSCKTNASSKVSQHTVVTVIFMIFAIGILLK